ncbi:DedA family protein [Streptomyces sp. NPDC002588]|uniref:DedA family protein n=1 Tax=Streptomyces sp. NPDC002588 TaxID=3154419 RepID=UPI00333038D6
MHVEALVETAGWWSYLVVFAMTAGETSAFVGLLLPGETVILLASAIAGRGDLNPLVLAVVVVVGGMAGDSLGFALGHRCERRLSGRRHRFRSDARIARARAFLKRHGGAAVFTGRFIGFVRTFLPFAAGSSGMPYRRFFLYSTAASLVWGVGNVLLGYFAGAATADLLHPTGLIGAAALAALAMAGCVVLALLRRRRRLARDVLAHKPSAGPFAASEQGSTHMFTSVQKG